jgi:hypothetical protein
MDDEDEFAALVDDADEADEEELDIPEGFHEVEGLGLDEPEADF